MIEKPNWRRKRRGARTDREARYASTILDNPRTGNNRARDKTLSFPKLRQRKKGDDCRRTTTEERNVPEIHVDLLFIGAMKGARTLALVVAREWRTTRFAVLVGIIVKSDSGTACRRAWLSHVALLRATKGGSRMIDEDSPVQLEEATESWKERFIASRSSLLVACKKSLLACPSFFQVALQVIVAVGLSGVNRSQKW